MKLFRAAIIAAMFLVSSIACHAQGKANVFSGSGSPEGVVAGTAGDIFISSDGTVYFKNQGAGKTGWILQPSSAAGLADPGGNGIVKRTALNVTAPGAAADVSGLWTGTCNSTTFLRGDGSCQVPSGSGTISGQANGVIPLGTTGTSVTQQSHLDDGITTPSVVTSTETVAAPSFGAGTAPTACGTATGCLAQTEAAGPGTATTGQRFIRADSVTHHDICSWNNGAETSCNPAIPSSWTPGHLVSLGVWPAMGDSASAHSVAIPLQCADTSASATTYTCTTSPSLGSLIKGDTFVFTTINQVNSGTSTLNIDAIGAKTITRFGGVVNAVAGDLPASGSVTLTYDGTALELPLPAQGQIVQYVNNSAVVPTGTQFASVFTGGTNLGTTQASFQVAAPRAGTVGQLRVQLSAAEGAAATFAVTFEDGSTGEALTCTVGNSASSCTDTATAHYFTWAAGDLLSWKTVQTGTGTNAFYNIAAEIW